MRFLQKDDVQKTFIIISDLHLGAGPFVKGKRNVLEEFHADGELIDFLDYFSTGNYKSRVVELVINGDFLDFLAVPYVDYFDDQFNSEKASLDKLELIIQAHKEIFETLLKFVKQKNKFITYIMGNHDGELLFKSVRDRLHHEFESLENFKIVLDEFYHPHKELLIMHGHTLERPHRFSPEENIITLEGGEKYFLPPWGSFFVTRVINKFKEERNYLGAFKPYRILVAHGIVFDTLFTLRMLFTSWYYLFMVRIIRHFHSPRGHKLGEFLRDLLDGIQSELGLSIKLSDEALLIFRKNPEVKTLVMGHNHEAEYTENGDGTTYLNTGTWTRFYHLDFAKLQLERKFTFAQIDFFQNTEHQARLGLHCWKGRALLPFDDFGT